MRMWMVMPAIFKLASFSLIVFALPLQGSTEAALGPSGHGVSFTGNPPSPAPRQIGSFSPPENDGLVPASSPSQPVPGQRNFPASPPSPPLENAPVSQAPLPHGFQSHAPSIPPADSRGKDPLVETPSSMPVAPVPTPARISPQVSPVVNPSAPMASPPSDRRKNSSNNAGPVSEPITPVSAASPPPTKEPNSSPPVPVISSPSRAPQSSPTPRESTISPVAAPLNKNPEPSPPMSQIPAKNGSDIAPVPSNLLPKSHTNRHRPALSPRASFKKPHNLRNKTVHPTPAPSYPSSPPPTSEQRGPAVPPSPLRARKHGRFASPPRPGPSPRTSDTPISSPLARISPTPAPSQKASSGNPKSVLFPATPPLSIPKAPPLIPPFRAFPPPPPNQDCSTTICTEPYANTPPGSPCSCVLPIQVGLRLSVSLYTFFPLVSELAQEIAAGVYVKQSQVRIIGANAANQQTDKTVVLVDLVPLGEKFDNTTAFWTYQRFWSKQVTIRKLYFGDYEVLYVRYPGLPEHPPSGVGMVGDGPYPGANDSGITRKPLGVDVPKSQRKNGLSGGVVAVLVLSSSLAVIFCATAAWIFLFRRRDENSQPKPSPHVLLPSISRPSVGTGSVLESRDSSATLSFGSSIATYTGSAKTFSASEIDRATEHFKPSRVIGEGGFGRVYSGVLEDGTEVAVKVLKRDDQQGAREFLAEVEMLGRLHHRNLVKLIGICVEDRARCLLYELISNGSVESHLHGVDKESAPLNWGSRVKIALGAARGLAYLHEDSSPRVIHRDFKSSNILLEDDFTPKVSDFGLARAALDEENQHISTRVMGTFGYVAPEYAMTGHLLVKSDVYSYGVVLLELLTGRKPVDMSQPPGEENLVSWARPLLTGSESLAAIIDRSLGPDPPLASAAKVAAIASMCVQPEVSNRPFMGEVVQALKLVYDEVNEEAMEDDHPEQTQCSVHSYERGMSASELFQGSSAGPATEDSESFRRHSSSGPIGGARRSGQFWERARTLSGGSVSEHSVGFKLWHSSN